MLTFDEYLNEVKNFGNITVSKNQWVIFDPKDVKIDQLPFLKNADKNKEVKKTGVTVETYDEGKTIRKGQVTIDGFTIAVYNSKSDEKYIWRVQKDHPINFDIVY